MAGINVPVTFTGDLSSISQGLGKSLGGLSRGFEKAASKAVGGFEKPFKSLGSGLANQGRQLGRSLADGMKTVLTTTTAATGAAVAGIMGTALTKGFSRLQAIDQAQAKLRGLGNDAETVEAIMGNALASVKGTAFGLGEAATTAAGAVAAGIAPGKQLEGVLTTVANTAAAAGTTMEEMGSIFNKVAANEKASNAELQQLADRGIPIYKALAEQLGVTQEEVFKLASAGKIGFAEFEAAATAASGNVAAEMGKTLTGSFDNLMAALGRIGANILGPAFEQLPAVLQGVTAALGPVEDLATSVGEKLGQVFKVLIDAFSGNSEIGEFEGALRFLNDTAINLSDAFTSISGKLSEVWAAMSGGEQTAVTIAALVGGIAAFGTSLAPLLGALGPVGSLLGQMLPTLGGLGGAFKFLLGPLGIIIGLFAAAFATSEEFRGAVFGLLEALLPLGETLISAIGPILAMLPGLFQMVVAAVTPLLTVIVQLAGDLISALVPVIQTLITSILPPLMELFQAIVPVVLGLVPVIAQLVGVLADILIPVIESLLPIVSVVFEALGAVIAGIVPIVTGIVDAVSALFAGDWQGAWDAFGRVGQAAMDLLWTFVEQSLNVGKAIITGLIEGFNSLKAGVGAAITDLGTSIINWFKSILGIASPSKIFTNFGKDILQGLINGIQALLGTVGTVVSSVGARMISLFTGAKDRVVGVFNSLVSTVTGAVSRLASGVLTGISRIISTMTSLPGRILGALGNLSSLLYDAGRNVIQGLMNGITAMAGAVADKARSVVQGAISGAKNLLGIASPSKVFMSIGEDTGEGLVIGIDSMLKAVASAGEGLADAARGPAVDLNPSSSARRNRVPAPAAVTETAGTVVNLNEYGPRTYSAKRRESEWAGKYSTRARTFADGALAIP